MRRHFALITNLDLGWFGGNCAVKYPSAVHQFAEECVQFLFVVRSVGTGCLDKNVERAGGDRVRQVQVALSHVHRPSVQKLISREDLAQHSLGFLQAVQDSIESLASCKRVYFTERNPEIGGSPKNATLTAFGLRGQRTETADTTPRVPSEPMNSCLRSYPVLSLRSDDRQSRTSPFANTFNDE